LLASTGRARYEAASDTQALEAVRALSESEGILPALESAHALIGAQRWAASHPDGTVLVCLSGRGDKDMPTLQQTLLAGRP
jgi:tryptophan synthase beta chain